MNTGKATDGMLDRISMLQRRITDATDFAILSAAAAPQARAFFEEVQAILAGTSVMGREYNELLDSESIVG